MANLTLAQLENKNSPRDGVDDIISVTKIKDNPFEEDE